MDIPIVIVGSGPVGTRVLRNIVRAKPETPVIVYGDEPWEPYDRIKLVSYLCGEYAWADLSNLPPLPENHRVTLRAGTRIVALDRQNRTVTDDRRSWQRYSKLLLATGSRPWIPDMPGTGLANVHTFRNVSDVRTLLETGYLGRRVAVLGGGLLGIEVACGLKKKGEQVYLVVSGRLLGRQLDSRGGDLVRGRLESLGIHIVFGRAREILGGQGEDGSQVVRSVSLFDGQTVGCDCVVIATGVMPAVDLALSSGLAVGRGIKVDDYLQTSDPFILAAGECAEHNGRVYSLVGPGFEQADIAAQNLLGGKAKYHGSLVVAQLKGADFPAFSCVREDVDIDTETRTLAFESSEPTCYRALRLRKGRLTGVVGVGEWPEAWRVREAVFEGHRITPSQSRNFLASGNLWLDGGMASVAAWPKNATVCSCMGVSKEVLELAIEHGHTCVEGLQRETSAGTGCGSCLPLLAELLNQPAKLPGVEGGRVLTALSMLALLLALLTLLPAVPPSDTLLGGWHIDKLWQENLWKQVSGYTLLTLSCAALLMSLRRRGKLLTYLSYPSWRLIHAAIGAFALATLALHTGLGFGHNFNQVLALDYLLLTIMGGLTGLLVVLEGHSHELFVRRLRKWGYWSHVLLFWPLPVLLAFHILTTYYF